MTSSVRVYRPMPIVNKQLWKRNRKRALRKLAREIKKGIVDKDILLLLKLINENKDFVTLSSCYGRVVLLETEHDVGDKLGSIFYKVWHKPVSSKELLNSIHNYNGNKTLWLQLQTTILHVSTYDLDKAIKFRNLALKAGYKHSKILSISKHGITIEILGSERLDIPVVKNGKILINKEIIKIIEKLIFIMFNRIEKRKNRFIELLKKKNLKMIF